MTEVTRRARDGDVAPKLRQRDDITGMRAVAVTLVVAFHAGITRLQGGYVGVDVFFVISGFLITALLVDELAKTGTISLRHFYARRMRRLLPLASITLIATVIAAHIILSPLDQGGVISDARAAALWFANWHFAAGASQYMSATDQSPTLHYWSLSVEEQFYVVWPLLLLALCARRNLPWPRIQRRAAIGLGAVFAVSLAASIMLTPTTGQWAYYGLHTRGWELALGGGLALARPLLPRLPQVALGLAGWSGLAMILASAIAFERTTTFPGAAALLPVVGSGLLIVAGVRGAHQGVPRLLATRPFVYVGEISYGWYLWHWPFLILGQAFANHGAQETDSVHTFRVAVAAILGSFLLAVLTHRLVERPARRSTWLSAFASRSLAFGAALVATVLTIGAAAEPSIPGLPASATVLSPATAHSAAVTGTVSVHSPAPLRMSPLTAARDFDGHDGCNVDIGPSAPTGTCQYGDPTGSRVVVLVGDSHAEQWRPALSYLAKQSHWRLYSFTKSACAFEAPRTYSVALKRPYSECQKFVAAAVRRIVELPRVDLLVVGRSYGYQTLDSDNHVLSGAAKTAEWTTQSAKFFDSVRPKVHQIAVFRDTPSGKTKAPSCLAAHMKTPTACSFDRTKGVKDLDQYDGERRAAVKRPVSFINLVPRLCPTASCPVVDDLGVIIYRDSGHLTATFSRLQWRLLGYLLKPLVTR